AWMDASGQPIMPILDTEDLTRCVLKSDYNNIINFLLIGYRFRDIFDHLLLRWLMIDRPGSPIAS
ncbi:hypothetical protein ACJX0J_018647, partial [Zea mays]